MLTIEKVKEMQQMECMCDDDEICKLHSCFTDLLDTAEAALLVVEAAKTVIRRLDGNGSYDDLGYDRLEDALKPFSPQPTKP